MNAIVSVTRDWGIGLRGNLLVRNPRDMRYFRDKTIGGTVICGQTTFLSFPGGALRGRRNVVLSLDPDFAAEGAEVVRSLDEALAAVAADEPDAVWVIGGESVYRQLIDLCERAYVTKNDVVLEADAYFPNLGADESWQVADVEGKGVTDDGIAYSFVVYERV